MKVAFIVIVVLALVGLMAAPTKAITCGQLTSSLAPCIQYLRTGGTPPETCCTEVRSLVTQVSSTADRQAACNCAKQAASEDQAIRDEAAASLPQQCGVTLPFPISRSIDCSTLS